MRKVIFPGLVAGFITLIIGTGLSFFMNFIFPSLQKEYANSGVFRLWEDPLMFLFILYPFVLGIALAWVWDRSKSLFQGTTLQRGFKFGLIYIIIATIPGMLMSYSIIQISLGMILGLTLGGFINPIVAGIIFAKMNA